MISMNEICTKESADYSLITSVINYSSNNDFDMQLSRPKNANEQGGQYQGSYESVKLVADMYRYLNNRIDNFNLPLAAYYPIERTQNPSLIQKNKIDTFATKSSGSSIDGYENSLTSLQNFNNFLGWYKKLSNVNLSINKNSEELKLLISKHKDELSSSFIQKIELEAEGNKSVSEFLSKFKSDKNKQIEILQQQLKSLQNPIDKKLKFINLAIRKFIPEFKNIGYENHPEEGLFVTKDGIKLNVQQLSQGERTLMALVGDISRRLILLNPSLDNPLHGTGIVLIDEIELHLHPSWQQKVLTKLTKTFPNIQFLITTHSPQVLTTCKKGEIRLLRANGQIETPLWDVYGRESGDALSELMDTEPRPPLDYVLLIEEYMRLIDLNEHDSEKGKSLRDELNLSLGTDHHELLKAERKIKRKELLK
jgi:predicted ATP-binding protein involved in virulence